MEKFEISWRNIFLISLPKTILEASHVLHENDIHLFLAEEAGIILVS